MEKERVFEEAAKVMKEDKVLIVCDRGCLDNKAYMTNEEFYILKSQFVTSSWGGTRKLPHAFTEQGLAMLSGLLNSDIAIAVNISIMRAFVALRKHIFTTQLMESELIAIKTRLELLERSDEDNLEAINDLSEDMRQEIDNIYQAIAALSVTPPEPPRKKIGFKQ